MRISTLLARNLTWYWRTNLAVLLGVATAAGVLGGAVLVGDSVRASLRGLVLARLGNADFVVTRNGFFREALAETLPSSSPVIAMQGIAAHEASGRRAAAVQVYGIDERFWKFQGEPGAPPRGRDILMTSALAQELGAQAGDDILLRVEKPSAIPLETLHGRKEDVGRTIRLTMSGVAKREFSLRQQQGDVRAVYVPLARLQRDLNQDGEGQHDPRVGDSRHRPDPEGAIYPRRRRPQAASLGPARLPVARKRQHDRQRRSGSGRVLHRPVPRLARPTGADVPREPYSRRRSRDALFGRDGA